mmetsp:Transcript_3699/g.8518  ORF Transcript_3699/g.8518 Transcript_3699/m.8518 type:complete len:381 (+) Transcript_3699:125-1267(+)
MNSSTPNSGRAPLQFAVPPTTTSSVGVGSFDSSGAPNPPATQATTLEALHLAARQFNSRVTRSHARTQTRPFRYSAAARTTVPTRSVHTRSARANANSSSVAPTVETTPTPEVVPSRSCKRRAPESTSGSQPTKTSPRKRARARATNLKKPPPRLDESSDDSQEPLEQVNCCICMCDAEPNDLAGINGCKHQFCFGCIEKWAERENTCPLCKVRFSKIDRKNKKRKKGQKNTKKVKQRDQRSDLVSGAALEGLLANFASTQPPNLARFFLSSVNSLGSIDFHSRSFRAITIARGGSSDNSDDDENPISSLFRVYHNTLPPPLMPMMQPMSFASRFSTSRSYASNSHDRTAGRGAENPLTIDDSDSDDDDIVVLSSRRGPL